MSIKAKIITGFIIIIMVFFVTMAVVFSGIKGIDSTYSDLVDRRALILVESQEVKSTLLLQLAAIRQYVLTGDEMAKQTYRNSSKIIEDKLIEIDKMVDSEEHRQQLVVAIEANEPLLEIGEKIILHTDTYDQANIPIDLLNELADRGRNIREIITTIIMEQETILKETSSSTTKKINESTLIVLVIALVVWVSIFAFSFFFVLKKIIQPIQRLNEQCEKIANLELDGKTVEIKGTDEIARLNTSFIKMKTNLIEMVQHLSDSAERVTHTSSELSVNAKETEAATSSVASIVQEIAENSSRQNEFAMTILQMAEESVEKVNHGLDQSSETLKVSQQSTQTAYEGNEAIRSAIAHLGDIKNAIYQASLSVQDLGKRSEEIEGIVTAITTIAEQTNLLALNAAIEAARAGESGKGFSVVAGEVRKLAEESNRSAEKIRMLITDIQNSTKKTIVEIKDTYHEIEKQSEIIEKGGTSLHAIVDNAEKTENSTLLVNGVLTDLRENLEKVTKSIEEITNIISETAASTEEVCASAKEQAATSTQISMSSDNLDKLANELKDQVRQVTL